jgi:uroporphyrin-III C-methyltransferase / precorrin-2 dehydrogenase / sirohydrochlorin ferrochelatase
MTAGFVSLVGAGPGDPDYLTQKAVRRLREADVVLHDALVSADVCALATHALRINVGKRANGDQTPQAEIERLLISAAQEGMRVVRLKGGDPFVFGRGGEEALALQRAGIAFEVVPGVTNAVGAPALAGIPVTHRGMSPGFVVINGADLDATDRALASIVPGLLTLVLLMAIAKRGHIAQRMLEHGWSAATPAAIVFGAGTPQMHTWRGSIAELVTCAAPEPLVAGTIVVGHVAALPIEMLNGIPISRETVR